MKTILLSILMTSSIALNAQDFGIFRSAMYLNLDGTTSFYNTQGTTIGSNTFTDGVAPTSALVLEGAEVQTFKNGGYNVCTATMYYVQYETGNRPATPVFTAVDLPHFEDCNGTNFPNTGGPCGTGDQKWQKPGSSGSSLGVDLTTGVGNGSYVLEVYYESTGDDGSGNCDQTRVDNNGGSNYTSTLDFSNLSVKEQDSPINTVNIFPNPVVDVLQIKGLNEKEIEQLVYQVYDAQGKLLMEGKQSSEINVNKLSAGAYILNLQLDDQSKAHKFIKK